MPDRESIIKGLECCINPTLEPCLHSCPYRELYDPGNGFKNCMSALLPDALALLKEQEGLLGIQQTADSITFVSTGTARQGEERGIMLGKSWMHEWLKKELLHRGLLTDEIRTVFDEAKRI